MVQAPMISSPLKQTNEIDWVAPLKDYIRNNYGDDPERYAGECATLNRLRQDMRGAGKDSAAGRDLLYRYYGQLELLDLRFPVDENHIKISFTWFDAFTHKQTAQYSLAYEKASIIFNISAVLSCHAAHQNRSQDAGLKTAYHSFQASAGMFTYINENFLHAPSTDLSRDTIKTLIAIMLAQAQEVFLEKQIADEKKVGLLAKLASQAGSLYALAAEGTQENVTKAVFEKVWLSLTQIKANYMTAMAQYYQALADNDANSHGVAIARLHVAERLTKDALKGANSLPQSMPANANLTAECSSQVGELTSRLAVNIQEKLQEFIKDNDFIYHQGVPSEAALAAIPKLPAAKAIPVSELYAGQDIQRIIGPDIFQKIVPMAVTESASLYDEEKAKLIRAETERVEVANGEMAASLDYLKLPGSLQVLKGDGLDAASVMDDDFRIWCADVAHHEGFSGVFDHPREDKAEVISSLDRSARQLDMEESVCEKMRSKYGADWTQQPSSRLTTTLRSDIRNYRGAIEEASHSDEKLSDTFRQYEADLDEMRSAGETDEADVLFQRAMVKVGASRGKSKTGENLLEEDFEESRETVLAQIVRVEEILKKLQLIKRERAQVLKDLKEKVHNDDISNVLILNKKSIANHESQLFQVELEKFRPHQTRLLQASHKQSSLLKELTATYGELLQDRRVQSDRSRHESITRQRNAVMSRYRGIAQAFLDLDAGLRKAQQFYAEMRETVESLERNVETFVNNRRSEGAQLLRRIEENQQGGGQADRERERLNSLMERMSMDRTSSSTPPKPDSHGAPPLSNASSSSNTPYHHQGGATYPMNAPPIQAGYPSTGASPAPMLRASHAAAYPGFGPPENGHYPQPQSQSYQHASSMYSSQASHDGYDPGNYPRTDAYAAGIRMSPPPHASNFSPSPQAYGGYAVGPPPYAGQVPQSYMPAGYVPPPPPPGPPPLGPQQSFPVGASVYPAGPGGYARSPPPSQRSHQKSPPVEGDPWGGLSAWR